MAEGAVAEARDLRLHHYLYLTPLTFLYWDHLLTFGDEVRYIWNKRKTASAYCFFFNRYLAFFGGIAVTVFSYHEVPDSVCKDWNMVRQILLIVNQVTVCILLTLRIYALYGRNTRVISCMLAAGAVLLAVGIYGATGASGNLQHGELGCNIGDPRHVAIMIAIPWEAVFIYDIIIFCLLFYKSLRTQKESGLRWSRIPMLSLLIRDGSIYFALMATVNLANILTSYIAPPLLVSCLSTFASNMSVTMMSRLMLNLHAVESVGIFSTSAPLDSDVSTAELDTLYTRDLERSGAVGEYTLHSSRRTRGEFVPRDRIPIDPERWEDAVDHLENTR
ncbi:hypothetical protein B0H11DRAFT_1956933 [Mycena galericulata]|nr:hypothetical protein B0H11DRAFT_1956933 [Mycena galericulata]